MHVSHAKIATPADAAVPDRAKRIRRVDCDGAA